MVRNFIRLVTEVPGPRSREVLARKDRHVAAAFSVHAPVVIDHGRGALVTDIDGNTFIDLTGGIGVLNVGHCHPQVTAAVHRQVDRFLHTDFTVIPYESLVALAERLAPRAPVGQPAKCAFFNSGAEAVENAIKIARAYTRRPAIIAFEGAFHGRTMMAMTLTSKSKPYRAGFGPYAPEVYRVPYAYCYRCPIRATYPECGVACADLLDRMLELFVAPEDTAAVIVEPVQGEGGFVVPPPEYLGRVAEICQKYGVLLIADEVQTGLGRTGRLFALEHSGVRADLVTVAKSLAAGIPLSGVVGRAEVMDAPGDNRIGGTYVGSPVGCVAALEVLDIMEREDLPGRAQRLGRTMRDRFEAMRDSHPLIGDVRGLGAMVGIELVQDSATKEPAPRETSEVLRRCMQKGVIPLKCGLYGNVIRMLVSLVITEEQLAEALDVMEEAIAEVEEEAGLKVPV